MVIMCVFCEIMNGNISSYTIYEDDIVKCFLYVNPKENGHILVVSKVHTLDLDTIDDKTLSHVMVIAKMLKRRLEDKLHVNGVMLVQNNGLPQEVKHYHLHLI